VTQRSCVLQPVAEEAVGSVSQVRINARKILSTFCGRKKRKNILIL
jgi:hypothetical protein